MTADPLRVLIVDDNVDSAMMLRMLLNLEGHSVRVEFDGRASIEAAEEFAPDVVLMDLSLPSLGGADAAVAIRALPGMSGCAIVAVTGHDRDVLPSLSPFDHYLGKPVDHPALLGYLAEVWAGIARGTPPRRAVA